VRQKLFSSNWKKFAGLAFLILACSLTGMADENDQYWLTGAVQGKLSDKITVKLSEQTRYKDEDHFYKHTDLGFVYKIGKGWSAGAIYRYQDKKNAKGVWQTTDGYLFNLGYIAKGLGAELKSRLRFTYFDANYKDDSSTDVRPRFDLSPAKGFTTWSLKPYIADEIMYNFDDSNLYRNRVFFGLKSKPCKKLSLDLFVMQERTETNDEWAENGNSGLTAALSF